MNGWYSNEFCIACHHVLTVSERSYSRGTCPHCGVQNASTFVKSYQRTFRRLPRSKWWKFWEPRRYEERK